jgi:hypothetical protein
MLTWNEITTTSIWCHAIVFDLSVITKYYRNWLVVIFLACYDIQFVICFWLTQSISVLVASLETIPSYHIKKKRRKIRRRNIPVFIVSRIQGALHWLSQFICFIFPFSCTDCYIFMCRPFEFLERFRMPEFAEGSLHPLECAQTWFTMVWIPEVRLFAGDI